MSALLAATLTLACARNFYATPAEWTSETELAVPAAGPEGVRLRSRQGPISIREAAGDSIRIALLAGPALGPMGSAASAGWTPLRSP